MKWFFFLVWIGSTAIFFWGQFNAPQNYHLIPNNPWGTLFAASFITSILSFILMLISLILQKTRTKSIKNTIETDNIYDNNVTKNTKYRNCPFCSEKILIDANKCRFCGEWINKIEIKKTTYHSSNKMFILFVLFILILIFGGIYIQFNENKFGSLFADVNKVTADPVKLTIALNNERNKANLASVVQNEKLNIAALNLSNDMISRNYWSYNSTPEGRDFSSFIENEDYKFENASVLLGKNLNIITENLVADWMNEESTRNIILNGSLKEIGIKITRTTLMNETTTIVVIFLANPLSETTPTLIKSNTNRTITNPKIDCVGPDGKHSQKTQKECDEFNAAWGNTPTLNPNEIIQCNMHINCGGGTKEMTRLSCEQSTCCSLSSGNILTSQNDCKQKQYSDCINQLRALNITDISSLDAGCSKYK